MRFPTKINLSSFLHGFQCKHDGLRPAEALIVVFTLKPLKIRNRQSQGLYSLDLIKLVKPCYSHFRISSSLSMNYAASDDDLWKTPNVLENSWQFFKSFYEFFLKFAAETPILIDPDTLFHPSFDLLQWSDWSVLTLIDVFFSVSLVLVAHFTTDLTHAVVYTDKG